MRRTVKAALDWAFLSNDGALAAQVQDIIANRNDDSGDRVDDPWKAMRMLGSMIVPPKAEKNGLD